MSWLSKRGETSQSNSWARGQKSPRDAPKLTMSKLAPGEMPEPPPPPFSESELVKKLRAEIEDLTIEKNNWRTRALAAEAEVDELNQALGS